jgi:hypothetical protein
MGPSNVLRTRRKITENRPKPFALTIQGGSRISPRNSRGRRVRQGPPATEPSTGRWPQQRRQHREADLSTEQTRAQAPAWISHAHGHQGWPQGDCRQTRARAQAAERMRPARAFRAIPWRDCAIVGISWPPPTAHGRRRRDSCCKSVSVRMRVRCVSASPSRARSGTLWSATGYAAGFAKSRARSRLVQCAAGMTMW